MGNDNEKQWFEKDSGAKRRPAGSPRPQNGGRRTTANSRPTGKKRRKIPKNPGNVPADKRRAQVVKQQGNTVAPKKPVPSKAPAKRPAEKKKVAKKADISPIKKKTSNKNKVDSYTKDRRKRARNKSLKTGILTTALVLMAVAVLIFVVHHLFNYIAVKPNLEFITNGSVEHTIGARALIVRDEEVVTSGTAGDLVTRATEGSRVSVGQNIAMVVPSDMEQVVTNLRDTQSQISEVQQELIMEGLATGADSIYDNINGSLGPIMDMIRIDAMNGNVSDMSSYSSSISVLLNQRETELSNLEFDDERLRTLRNDEEGYEIQLEKHAANVSAPYPGIISFKLDGLEQELTMDRLLSETPSVIKDYISSSTGIITSDLYVDQGENLARIASNEKQYLAVFLDEKNAPASSFEVGSLHTINVGSEGISIGKCVVERMESTGDGLYVVFSTTRYVEDLLDLRTVDIEIVITESSGLRVPIGALVSPDYERGVATVYVNNQGFADEVGVIIVDYDREFAIIEPIGDSSRPNLQTVIVTNPASVKPGDKIE